MFTISLRPGVFKPSTAAPGGHANPCIKKTIIVFTGLKEVHDPG